MFKKLFKKSLKQFKHTLKTLEKLIKTDKKLFKNSFLKINLRINLDQKSTLIWLYVATIVHVLLLKGILMCKPEISIQSLELFPLWHNSSIHNYLHVKEIYAHVKNFIVNNINFSSRVEFSIIHYEQFFHGQKFLFSCKKLCILELCHNAHCGII